MLEDEEGFAASVTLDRNQPGEYAAIPWEYPAGPQEALVIHTLCIRPSRGGQGLGKRMVEFAIREAEHLGCQAVRLDTGAQNKPAIGLYTKMGFRLASSGTILLDGQIAHKDHVFMEYPVKF